VTGLTADAQRILEAAIALGSSPAQAGQVAEAIMTSDTAEACEILPALNRLQTTTGRVMFLGENSIVATAS